MDKAHAGATRGRERPAYQPRNIRCEGCGAGLSVKDERAELVVCEYCGSHLDVSATERKVVGRKTDNQPFFPFRLGDAFHYQSARFEVIARLAFIEDGDVAEMTREYLLYHPRRPSRWLGEYQGNYSMTATSHVMPQKDPFNTSRGGKLKTHDGKAWVCEGRGTYELHYVDGALPWIASVGDRVDYAEFVEESGTGRIYEAQRIANEIEYGRGRRLDLETVRRAARKSDLGKTLKPKASEDAAVARRRYVQMMSAAALALVVNVLAAVFCYLAGTEVLSESFSAAELTEGAYSEAFRVAGNGAAVRINARTGLSNAWMTLEAALVREDDMMVHQYESNIEYYHGRSGGENWSEGSRNKSVMVRVPDGGNYRLFVMAVSAKGNANRAERALHGARMVVTDEAQPWGKFAVAAGISFFVLIITAVLYGKWKQEDED
ncbi:MAG: DUF4178 domain-containing protein [Desulfobacterales bacterium]|nr:DUF4178 domain-containing protein [Desulfobacterales bacterium]